MFVPIFTLLLSLSLFLPLILSFSCISNLLPVMADIYEVDGLILV